MKDHYAELGIASDATSEQIKQAYRRKALQLHPDRNSAADAADKFRAVQEAYETLSDGNLRQAYDENRRRNLLEKRAREFATRPPAGRRPAIRLLLSATAASAACCHSDSLVAWIGRSVTWPPVTQFMVAENGATLNRTRPGF